MEKDRRQIRHRAAFVLLIAIACVLTFNVAYLLGQLHERNTSGQDAQRIVATNPAGPWQIPTNSIHEMVKSGIVCQVEGHKWGPPMTMQGFGNDTVRVRSCLICNRVDTNSIVTVGNVR